jgi:4-hydroxy-2-oxoglutarate aldolase
MRLRGVGPALTTPYADGEVSLSALRRNIGRYERLALAGYLVLGSTGEAVLLDTDERRRVLEAARAAVPAGKLLVAGVSSEATRDAFRQLQMAADLGADAALVSTPHYFRAQMTSEALVTHVTTLANDSPLPLLLYNVPKFTGLVLPVEAVLRLSEHERVVGIKDSSGDLDYLGRIVTESPPGFQVVCGDSSILAAALDAGAAGAILAAATVFPESLIRVAAGEGPAGEAMQEAATFIAGRHGVAGIKAALDMRGLDGGPVRSPLLPVSSEVRVRIGEILSALVEAGVIARLEW